MAQFVPTASLLAKVLIMRPATVCAPPGSVWIQCSWDCDEGRVYLADCPPATERGTGESQVHRLLGKCIPAEFSTAWYSSLCVLCCFTSPL